MDFKNKLKKFINKQNHILRKMMNIWKLLDYLNKMRYNITKNIGENLWRAY